MQFTITYEGKQHTVRLLLLADGYFPAAVASALATMLAPLRLAPGRAIELGLEPVDVLFDAFYPQGAPEDVEQAEIREVLLNTVLNQCLAEGRAEGWEREGTAAVCPWRSWSECSRTETQPILEAAAKILDAEDEEIARMGEFYAADDDADDASQRRSYMFRSEIDKAYWRFVHATGSIIEAARAMRECSRHASERYLILKNMQGVKEEEEDDE